MFLNSLCFLCIGVKKGRIRSSSPALQNGPPPKSSTSANSKVKSHSFKGNSNSQGYIGSSIKVASQSMPTNKGTVIINPSAATANAKLVP